MRIIAGSARGRRFDAPEGMDTRPTLDRVKEAVFGRFQFELPGSHVLDLFSGSGNLGLEAVSRGAASAVCNDRSPACTALIAKNARLTGLDDRITVMQLDYAACVSRLQSMGKRFHFVFIDAPYRDGTGRLAAELLLHERLLCPDGKIVLEHSSDGIPVIDGSLGVILDTRRYGACSVSIIQGVEQL